MTIIFVRGRHGRSGTVALSGPIVLLVLAGLLLLVAGAFAGGVWFSAQGDAWTMENIESQTAAQEQQIVDLKAETAQQVDTLTLRVGELQARLMRLEALGQRLTEVADIDSGEFDFSSDPALGGPDISGELGGSFTVPELAGMLSALDARLSDREQKLQVLDGVLQSRELEAQRTIAGKPVKAGWISSYYGYRTDPFTGRRAFHSGIDFPGKPGSNILSVASGVVTLAERHPEYGNMVEVDHGNGLVTRYAHAKSIQVKVGDIVSRGQVIAAMGSTGRSSGTHVHFEVLKNGRQQNPLRYVSKTRG